MQEPTLQERFFDLILNKYGRRVDAVAELCTLLNTSKDPIYRRLRGDTALLPHELELLARHFQISLDALIYGQSHNVVCSFNSFDHQVKDFADYLENYVADLGRLRRLPDVHLYYASAEIPVMTYHFMPELIGFKLYVWGRTTWNLDYLHNRPFDFDLMTEPVQRLSRQVLELYLHTDSTELWSLNVADNTLAQIEYHVYSGGFRHANDAVVLCEKLLEWTAHMKRMAAAGRKFVINGKAEDSSSDFHLFHNEMVYTNNTALILSGMGAAVYSAFSNPNFLKSTDPKLCAYTEHWFRSIIAKSNPITQSAEKSRDWFFLGLTKKIERAKQRILTHIEENE